LDTEIGSKCDEFRGVTANFRGREQGASLFPSGKRLLLDIGEGPPPGKFPDVAGLPPVDAVILSHGHKDHIGGLTLLSELGNPPVYATEPVARALPKTVATRPLPIGRATDVLGIGIETGRNGHAPGGIWLHFRIGGGFPYTGDICTESFLYAYDPPASAAATALIDCSYGDYQKPLAECWRMLARFVGRGPLLLPVPANGRGPEIALELMRHGIDDIYVDGAMRDALQRLAGSDQISLRTGLRDEIERLVQIVKPIDGAHGIMLAAAGGSVPPDRCAALRTKLRARLTAAAAIPAQAELQNRCATGIMVWAWILS
jgi:Cft2 family RNA processing exonuclease